MLTIDEQKKVPDGFRRDWPCCAVIAVERVIHFFGSGRSFG